MRHTLHVWPSQSLCRRLLIGDEVLEQHDWRIVVHQPRPVLPAQHPRHHKHSHDVCYQTAA